MLSKGESLVGGPRPQHQQLRDLLAGKLVPGRPIPAEDELILTYGVTRATVRRAIDDLVAEGLLQRTPDEGAVAVRPWLDTHRPLTPLNRDPRRRGANTTTTLLSVTLTQPPAAVAAGLGLDPGMTVWRVLRVQHADREPIAHEDGWYPAHLLPDLDRHDLGQGSLDDILGEQYGLRADHSSLTLWGEAADAELAGHLACPVNTPLLVFRRIASAAGRPTEYVVSRYRGDRYQVHLDLGRDALSPAEST